MNKKFAVVCSAFFINNRCYNYQMISSRIVEYVFFFGLLGGVGYLVWLMFEPFVVALALAAIIVTICYPIQKRILAVTPKRNKSIAALLTTLLVFVIIILPVVWVTSLLVSEALSVYRILGEQQFALGEILNNAEVFFQTFIPAVDLNVTEYLRQGAEWLASRTGAIFAGTAMTVFQFFIAMIASFYFFRDGREMTRVLIKISPLPDNQDEMILSRMASAVRAVATGTVLIAIIQGTLTAIGLSIIGFDRSVLLGTIAAFGALIPGVGTAIVIVPTVIYLVVTASYVNAIIFGLWGVLAVGLIDNLLGPYLMSRSGASMHPFIILISVLGGISLFGPIGFVVGPVITSLFLALLELYSLHIAEDK